MADETSTFIANFLKQLNPAIQGMVQSSCQAYLGQNGQGMLPATTGNAIPGASGSTYPVPTSGCPYPVSPASANIPGCPVNCDPCAFPQVALDLSLYSFPQIEPELWDQQTSIDVLDALAPGGTLTLSQEVRRTLSWIPGYVSISSTWSGGDPQPGMLTYQWASASKGAGPAGVQFGPPQKGQQYECGDNCIQLPFMKYKGCDGVVVGSLSKLQLIVSLSANATSTLEGLTVTVYHKQNAPKKACCGGCASGSACSC